MDGKPVGNRLGTNEPKPSTSKPKASAKSKATSKGKFGSYTAEARNNVKPRIPSAPQTPFQLLHGLFLPDPGDFFTFFERPLLHLPVVEVIGPLTLFNYQLLEHMGFPDETRDFFNNWALVDAEFATTTDEKGEQLLKEANELLKSAQDDAVYEKVTLYREGKAFDITPTEKSCKEGFSKLWDFFGRLFTSPFSFLSSKKEQAGFRRTLEILDQRVYSTQPRSVSKAEPNASIKTPKEKPHPVSIERKEEMAYILNCRKQTPVYYGGELHHFQHRLSEQEVLLKKADGNEINARIEELYLPPSYKEATKIVNPADVELPSDHILDPFRESELLYICAYIEKGDEVLYKGMPCTVTDVTTLDTSPQVMLKTRDGRDIDAALCHIQLPPDSEELPILPDKE